MTISKKVLIPSDHVLVHADGGKCHGAPLDVYGRCTVCGITPDMQSTEFWSPKNVRKAEKLRREFY